MTKKSILIIEDEEDVLKPLVFRLRHMGHEVITASDGESGLQKAEKELPALIILDLCLPKLSGEEVCKSLRENDNERIASIPILMLTAKSSEVDRIVGKVIGANEYLTKPFENEELMSRIERIIL